MKIKEKNEFIYDTLLSIYPNPKCELDYNNEYELLIKVILSAQCTDKRVNQISPVLFSKYKTVYDLAKANKNDVIEIIRSCGFYNSKSEKIINACKQIVSEFNGVVPNTLENLIKLDGVGRKTANVVLSTIYNKPAIAVDTHVFRVSNRLGIAKTDNVLECEKQLMKNFNDDKWSNLHHLLVLFGRYKCKAIKPDCENCSLAMVCKEKKWKK